ncbi:MAG: hypothetical protein LBL00_06125 [Endomicrobium sp.]|jgi:YD repeat-containing protein|nr:hypothetical protein [Endomicrobium sp.]
MKNLLKVVLLLTFAVFAVTWIGCSKDDKKSAPNLTGVWEYVDDDGDRYRYEFTSDGKVIASRRTDRGVIYDIMKGTFSNSSSKLTIALQFTWDLGDDTNNNGIMDEDELQPYPGNVESSTSYTVSGNSLTIEAEGVTYTRIE